MSSGKGSFITVICDPGRDDIVDALCDKFEEVGLEDVDGDVNTYTDKTTRCTITAGIPEGREADFRQMPVRRLVWETLRPLNVYALSINCWGYDNDAEHGADEWTIWRYPPTKEQKAARRKFERRLISEYKIAGDKAFRLAGDGLFDEAVEPLDEMIRLLEQFQRQWIEWYGEPKEDLTTWILSLEERRADWASGPRNNLS
jgi:hypothetical protein